MASTSRINSSGGVSKVPMHWAGNSSWIAYAADRCIRFSTARGRAGSPGRDPHASGLQGRIQGETCRGGSGLGGLGRAHPYTRCRDSCRAECRQRLGSRGSERRPATVSSGPRRHPRAATAIPGHRRSHCLSRISPPLGAEPVGQTGRFARYNPPWR